MNRTAFGKISKRKISKRTAFSGLSASSGRPRSATELRDEARKLLETAYDRVERLEYGKFDTEACSRAYRELIAASFLDGSARRLSDVTEGYKVIDRSGQSPEQKEFLGFFASTDARFVAKCLSFQAFTQQHSQPKKKSWWQF